MASLTIPVLRDEIPDEEKALGYFQMTPAGAIITIDSRLEGDRELVVFLHELIHAIDEGAGLGLKHTQVAGLGEMLAQALRPHLSWGA